MLRKYSKSTLAAYAREKDPTISWELLFSREQEGEKGRNQKSYAVWFSNNVISLREFNSSKVLLY